MTKSRTEEIMAGKGFIVPGYVGGVYVFHYSEPIIVEQRGRQDFWVHHKPKDVWLEHEISFHNPIAAATYAVRHIIPKQVRYTGR